ncbi:hypothetical protein D9615_008901 [Tricholomella constricta]|uniref:HNH nuclease domain-containing protein n=1 Tax=Tricholomella constricta TaxID=117010 RepID=A0A8H5LYG9_9AGAR|nr:hypothetical protein D9615_008901 [Tricholomella constricta]
MSNLPPVNSPEVAQLGPSELSAYRVCLAFEQQVTEQISVIHARILGYLILHAPTENGRHEVVKAIHSCNKDFEVLSELGQAFLDYFIRPFKELRRWTPASSDNSSRTSSDEDEEDLQELETIPKPEAPKNRLDAKNQALERDGLRCVVTGLYDHDAAITKISVEEIVAAGGAVGTGCAYIVPDPAYLDAFNTPMSSPLEKKYSASVLAILKDFGYDVESLTDPNVHSLFNVMTMQFDVHVFFDRLNMWFEGTEIANFYKIQTISEWIKVPKLVNFTSSNPTKYPDLPSPKLLALHAACAKVAHLSGAGEYIDSLIADLDYLDELAFDGSTSAVLNHALMNKAARSIGAW